MDVFEQLRPFVFLCQFSGFTPFRINFHPETKRFQRFVFSWRHPLTCWFIFRIIVQIVMPFWEIYFYFHNISVAAGFSDNLPIAMYAFTIVGIAFHGLELLLSRYISLYFSAFRRALDRIQHTNAVLVELPDQCKLTLRTRIVAGMICITIGGATSILGYSAFYSGITEEYSILFTAITISMDVIETSFLGCNFLIVHLSYYLVSYYIRLLGFNLLKDVNDKDMIAWPSTDLKGLTLKSKLRSSRRLFGELCQATAALNNVFNFPVLCIIICKLIGMVFTLFILIYRFMNPQDQFASFMQPTILVSFIRDFLTMLSVCHAADMPVVQAAELREKIIGIITKDILRDSSEKFEALSYLQHINEERVRLSAAGLFQVGVHLFPSLTAAIATYLIVLLQTQTE